MKRHIIFLTIVMIFMSGCGESFLDRAPKGSLTGDIFGQNEDDALALVTGVYRNLTKKDRENTRPSFGDIASDDAIKGGGSAADVPEIIDIENFYARPDNSICELFFRLSFNGIIDANYALQKLPTIPIEDDKINRMIAEVRFLRAFFYFDLVRVFGDLPLLTHYVTMDEFQTPRTSREEIGEFIISELEECVKALPGREQINEAKEYGRVTKDAANGLLARACLFFAFGNNADAPRNQQLLTKAKNACLEVINAPFGYVLEPDYGKLFRKEGDANKELVYEVIHVESGINAETGGNIMGIWMRCRNSGGWGFDCPTLDLVNEFEEGDKRLLYTIYQEGDTFEEEVQSLQGYTNSGFHARKFFQPKSQRPKSGHDSDINVREIRLADIYLMYAEALIELNENLPVAADYINKVRYRAMVSTPNIDPQADFRHLHDALRNRVVTEEEFETKFKIRTESQKQMRDALRHERRVEFGIEQQRMFDLIRWRTAETILPKLQELKDESSKPIYGDKGRLFDAAKNYLFPIPQIHIDRSNGAMSQNPGY